ncbi:hypothetical protein AAHA92_00648 [Salvia divinorum]|uniref:Uncharacterized protein n=1 Tax=Salvia divinorum TaxID=28513 RepID=A0ABD1IK94_SALDI
MLIDLSRREVTKLWKKRRGEVWREIKTWLLGMRRIITTIPSAIKWMTKERSGVAVIRKARRLTLIATVSLIWRAQNALIFYQSALEVKKVSLYTHQVVQQHLGV